MKHLKEYKINENTSNENAIIYHLRQLKQLDFDCDLDIKHNRLYLTKDNRTLIDTNNNQQGLQSMVMFLAGLIMGIQHSKK